MNKKVLDLIDKLCKIHSLEPDEYQYIIDNRDEDVSSLLAQYADIQRREIYSDKVFIRGLIEISNICKNDCLYCGIRKSNNKCERYRLERQEILECADEGYILGFRTFVLQGGEDAYYTDEVLVDIISQIKARYPECAVTLSLGERSKLSYKRLFDAGADRYLLRHETADSEHYSLLHPSNLTLEDRINCLYDLREIGFQVGCGFMVGSPYQTTAHIAKDLKFIEEFKPDMCGIGPFIPHCDTPFADMKAGTAELTCFLLSIIRLIYPPILLPATTALGTIDEKGREKGILSGANVVMPNLSPLTVRKKYLLYNNKISTGSESAQCKAELEEKIKSIGYRVVTERGDIIK